MKTANTWKQGRNLLAGLSLFLLLPILLIVSCSKEETPDLPNADEYITWKVNELSGYLALPADSVATATYGSDTHIAGQSGNGSNSLYLIFSSPKTPGKYKIHYFDCFLNNTIYMMETNTLLVNLQDFGEVGSYMVGSYSGTVRDSSFKYYPISGHFRIKAR